VHMQDVVRHRRDRRLGIHQR